MCWAVGREGGFERGNGGYRGEAFRLACLVEG